MPEHRVRQANQGMISAAFSPDGQLEFIGSFNHGGSLWRTRDEERLYNWNHSADRYSAMRNAVFSDDNKFVATTEGNTMVLWDTTSGEAIRYWETPSRILSIDMARQYVLLGQENNFAVLFDTVQGGIIGTLQHDAPVTSVSMDNDAMFAATGSLDGSVRYWSLDTGAELERWTQQQPIELVVLSGSGKIMFTAAYQGAVSLWSLSTSEETRRLYDKNPGITSARFDSKEERLLLGTSRERIILWELAAGQATINWKVPNDGPWHKAAILSVSFSNEPGNYLAAASNGYTYHLN